MKRVVTVLLVLLLCCSCTLNKKDNISDDNIVTYDDSYIEVIPDSAKKFIDGLADDIILTPHEIEEYNAEIRSKTDSIFNLSEIDSITSSEIRNLITKYTVPTLPKYTGNGAVTNSEVNNMLANRNLDNITDKKTITKGIIVARANLKSFPTDVHFYDSNGVYNFDRVQETELHVNTPVLIVHESSDEKWYFVISYAYCGWVEKNDIALAKDEDFDYFINSREFAIITDALVDIDGTLLDMSTKLPYLKAIEEGYQVVLPIKEDNGYVSKKEVVITRDKAHLGYLPYTKRNVYIEAFKYEGHPYKWSGMDDGVDCSSYISNVFRTFGFMFPRNTADQNGSVGQIIDVSNKSTLEKLNILSSNSDPVILYQPGHAMIYLGILDEKHYIIHASGSDLKVVTTELNTSSSYLKKINKIDLIR